MDIDLKPSNGTGENRKEGKDRRLLPGDNRSAVCKWITGKGEKEKERTLRSHLESVPRLCGSWQHKEAVGLVSERSRTHANSSI